MGVDAGMRSLVRVHNTRAPIGSAPPEAGEDLCASHPTVTVKNWPKSSLCSARSRDQRQSQRSPLCQFAEVWVPFRGSFYPHCHDNWIG